MNKIIKHHRIKITRRDGSPPAASIAGSVNNLPGVSEAQLDDSGVLDLKYDLLETNLENIEQSIKKLNIDTAAGFFNKVKRGWIHFTEKNEYDNLMSTPTNCCALDDHERIIRHDVKDQGIKPRNIDLRRRGMERF